MPETTTPDGIDLITLLEEHNRHAIGYSSDEVSVDLDSNLDRYLGKPYGDEEEGRSNAMSMDVAEVVDWALPDLLEPFVSGDRIVEFEPNRQADEGFCDQASDLANYVFWRDNNGFLFLHDTIKTGCIQKIGITKTVARQTRHVERQTIEGLARINVEQLAQEDGVTIERLESESISGVFNVSPEAQAAYDDGMSYTAHIRRECTRTRIDLTSIPPEQFRVSSRASSIDGVEYCVHEVEKRRGELLAMGFDKDLVESCKSEAGLNSSRSDARFTGESRKEGSGRRSDKLLLLEEYLTADLDGEGEKTWQIFRVGKTKLGQQEVDAHPFDVWSPDRIPHRLIGLALADKVKQTQKIKTHLTRNMLDNVYLANNPRIEVPDRALVDETISDLLTYRIGGLIRTKESGMLRPIEVPDKSGMTLQAIQYMDGVREQQSGVTRNGVSVQSEQIDPKSAYQSRKEDRNEQARKRLMCRLIAETLLVPVFRKILRLIVRHQDAPRTIELRGHWVTMDPRSWNADLHARTAVGLGYTNREEEISAATVVGNLQMQAQQFGLVDPKRLYRTAERVVKAVGWSFADDYFLDPGTPEGQEAVARQTQQTPDPKMVEAQGRMQLKQAEAQHQAQVREADMQARMREADMQARMDERIAVMKAESERQIATIKAQSEAQISTLRLAMEERLAIREQDMEAELAQRRLVSQPTGRNGAGGVRFGGAVG